MPHETGCKLLIRQFIIDTQLIIDHTIVSAAGNPRNSPLSRRFNLSKFRYCPDQVMNGVQVLC